MHTLDQIDLVSQLTKGQSHVYNKLQQPTKTVADAAASRY